MRDLSDPKTRSLLRLLVSELDRRIGLVHAADGVTNDGMRVSWAALVETLDLGEEPRMRACPVCGQSIRAEATRCGFCWRAIAS